MRKIENIMNKTEAIAIAKEYKDLLSQYLSFSEIVLFGSYSNDTANPDSDIDIAIVVDFADEDYFSQIPLLWKLRRQVDFRIEPILIDKNDDKLNFFDEIMNHGIVIN